MIEQVIPEVIIWEYVAQSLGYRNAEKLSGQEHFRRLPREIFLSEGFLEAWKRNVFIAVKQKIIEAFSFRPFLFLEHDQVSRYTVADPGFWKNLGLTFSVRAVYRLWEEIQDVDRLIREPDWHLVTPSDALFLAILDEGRFLLYPFKWLLKNNSPWIVSALFLVLQNFSGTGGLPWRVFLEEPASVPLPLRELLIERTARYYEVASRTLQVVMKSLADGNRQATHADEHGIFFLFDSDTSNVLRFLAENPIEPTFVKKAYQFWIGEGALGLDDDRYIEGAARQFQLFQHMDEFARNAKDLLATLQAVQEAVSQKEELTIPDGNPENKGASQ